MSHSHKNLFIVRSPLQGINAFEAAKHFNTSNNICIVIYNSALNNTKQVKYVVDTLNVYDEIIEIHNFKSKLLEYVKLIKKFKKTPFDKVFVGEFSSVTKIMLANLNYKNSFLIDDGIATLNLYQVINRYYKKFTFTMRELRFAFFGLKFKISKKISFFTVFNLENEHNFNVISHNYENLMHYIFSDESRSDENTVYLLGQKLIDDDIVSKECYFNYINQIKEKFIGKKILYIPHRNEPIYEGMNAQFSDENFQFLTSEMPIELFFLVNKIYPAHIISFFSSALFTLNAMFPKSTIESCIIPDTEITKWKERLHGAYQFLDNTTIQKHHLCCAASS